MSASDDHLTLEYSLNHPDSKFLSSHLQQKRLIDSLLNPRAHKQYFDVQLTFVLYPNLSNPKYKFFGRWTSRGWAGTATGASASRVSWFSNSTGMLLSAGLPMGAGSANARPWRLLLTCNSGTPRRRARVNAYGALPVALCASWDSKPSSRAWRRPSAEAIPWARNCSAALEGGAPGGSARMPPSSRTSPPSPRACTPTSETPVSLNCTAPRARDNAGVSGVIRTSLPPSVRRPCTCDWRISLMGRVNRRRRSALPVPLA